MHTSVDTVLFLSYSTLQCSRNPSCYRDVLRFSGVSVQKLFLIRNRFCTDACLCPGLPCVLHYCAHSTRLPSVAQHCLCVPNSAIILTSPSPHQVSLNLLRHLHSCFFF